MRVHHRLAAVVAVFLAVAALLAPAAFAFEPPGLASDAQRYARDVRRAAPAGGTPQQRAEAERRANEAAQRNDWPAAIAAHEQRLALGAASDPRRLAGVVRGLDASQPARPEPRAAGRLAGL